MKATTQSTLKTMNIYSILYDKAKKEDAVRL